MVGEVHTCAHDCSRPACVIRRLTEERDELLNALRWVCMVYMTSDEIAGEMKRERVDAAIERVRKLVRENPPKGWT
jgi:hypothetical protein